VPQTIGKQKRNNAEPAEEPSLDSDPSVVLMARLSLFSGARRFELAWIRGRVSLC
jgi:hypothetical protein